MSLSPAKTRLLNIIYFLFVLSLIFKLTQGLKHGYAKESWGIAEFLINYQGGFVRRGLLGEFILQTYRLTGLSPYIQILAISLLAYITLIWFFLKSFIRKGYALFILPFIFLLGNPIINDFWIRKDILIILLFISIIYSATRKSNLYLILTNLLFIIALLIHESIGFFCFPILILLLTVNKNNSLSSQKPKLIKAFVISLAQLLPSLLAFFTVLYHKGNQLIANQIWASWKPITFPIQAKSDQLVPTAIDGISWSLKEGLSYTLSILTDFSDGIYAPLAWLLILSVIYYISINSSKLNFSILNYTPSKSFNHIHISNLLIFQLLTISPLFILGWDYGRWVFYWMCSSFALLLIVPEATLSALFPKAITSLGTRINHFFDFLPHKASILLLCVLIGFPTYAWDLDTSVNTTALVATLKFISSALHELLHLIKKLL